MSFEAIKRNYDHKLWSKAQVRVAVRKGVINHEEYRAITGERY